MVAFDTARVERALRGPLGEKAAQELTAALAEALAEAPPDPLATRPDVRSLGAEIRESEQRIVIIFDALVISLAGIALGALAIGTTVILLTL